MNAYAAPVWSLATLPVPWRTWQPEEAGDEWEPQYLWNQTVQAGAWLSPQANGPAEQSLKECLPRILPVCIHPRAPGALTTGHNGPFSHSAETSETKRSGGLLMI